MLQLKSTGIPTNEQVESKFPTIERINKKGVAVIECYQDIPCNPCATSCPTNAIYIGNDINNQPILNEDLCTGCGICIYNCPGLSITVFDGSRSEESLLVKIPYEMLPIPSVGDIVQGIDRSGKYITDVQVVKVMKTEKMDKTAVITIEVDKKYIHDFITIRVNQIEENTIESCDCNGEINQDEMIICRCSDITKSKLHELMEEGYTTFDELKRIARIGMGPCQGRTCGQLVARELAMFTSKPIESFKTHSSRPTVLGVKLKSVAGGAEDGK